MTKRKTPLVPKPIRVALIGSGLMARHHISVILAEFPDSEISVICEPSAANYTAVADQFKAAGKPVPPNEPNFERLLADYRSRLDVTFILSPHAYHHDQAIASMEAGLDVLLEKPMVMNAAEAHNLIATRDRTGKLLVVAFQGSLSPHIRTASTMLHSGELGKLLNISAVIWQDWATNTTGTWRQEPAISGGGFLFDTGAHMLNTVADLAGEEFTEVAAWLDNRGRPVEILAAIMGRLESGALVTMNACGETAPSCASDIRVFCTEGFLRTGAWGGFLEMQRPGERALEPVEVPASLGVWDQFLAVREGRIPNPSPPEVGLRMARLYDAIKESAALNGAPVRCR